MKKYFSFYLRVIGVVSPKWCILDLRSTYYLYVVQLIDPLGRPTITAGRDKFIHICHKNGKNNTISMPVKWSLQTGLCVSLNGSLMTPVLHCWFQAIGINDQIDWGQSQNWASRRSNQRRCFGRDWDYAIFNVGFVLRWIRIFGLQPISQRIRNVQQGRC